MATDQGNPLDDPAADPFAIAKQAAAQLADATGVERHDIALTLGSGWAKAADLIGETTATIPATDIIGFSRPALVGHVGTLRSVLLPNGKRALVIGARTHFYEGHGVRRVVHSVRTAAAAGATTMILTNGAGGIRESWTPGTPVLISDHINLTAASPLEGATFIDLTDLYAARLRALARTVAPSWTRACTRSSADRTTRRPPRCRWRRRSAGTSSACRPRSRRSQPARPAWRSLGLSLITNLAAGISPDPLSHAEVLQAGRDAEPVISALLARIVAEL